MAQLFQSFIPTEFLDRWMSGRYVIGASTPDYQYAGLAIILRGFYRYDVYRLNVDAREPVKSDSIFGGYGVAYIQGHELNFAGYRLYNPPSGLPGAEAEATPLFWKSVFSRFIKEEDNLNLYFPYYVFPEWRPRCSEIESKFASLKERVKTKEDLDRIEADVPSGGPESRDHEDGFLR